MSRETRQTLVIYLVFLVLIGGFAYMLVENTRLTVVNHRLESELVDSRNLANGYEWQLEQINESNGWSEDE